MIYKIKFKFLSVCFAVTIYGVLEYEKTQKLWLEKKQKEYKKKRKKRNKSILKKKKKKVK